MTQNRKPARKSLRNAAIAAALCLPGAAFAQDLAAAMPAGSLVAFGQWADGDAAAQLRADLKSLDWQGGLDTVMQLAAALGTTEDLEVLTELFGGPDLSEAACPALFEAFDPEADHGLQGNMLSAIGFTPFNPAPAFTMLAEFGPEHDQLFQDVLGALEGCTGTVDNFELQALDQDGTPFWQATLDYDLSFSFAREGGVLALSTSQDQLRYVLRLLGGSDEPSLADSRLYGDYAALDRGTGGFDWYVDYTVAADLAETFMGNMGSSELGKELAASLRTAGGHVGSLSLQQGQLSYHGVSLPDPAGSDTELFSLLLSDGLSLPAAPIVPEGAVSVSSQVINVQGATGYLQGWLDRLAPMVGENLDLRELLAAFDVDLDAVLLDWIGTDVHTVQLEPVTSGLASLIRGPAQLVSVAVTDEAAAMAGVEQLFELVAAAGSEDPSFDFGLDVRDAQYRGVDYSRVRVGPITDFGVAAIDGYLVFGLPSSSLLTAIDTVQDGSGSADELPSGGDVLQAARSDIGLELSSVVSLLDQLVQPIAFTTRVAALEELNAPDWDEYWEPYAQDWSDGYVYETADLSGITFDELALGTAVAQVAELDPATDMARDYWFSLQGIEPGTAFSVLLGSEDFDASLDLYELETGNLVAYNDDYDYTTSGRDARIDYTAREGVTYVVHATAWDYIPVGGGFSISLEAEGGESAAEEEVAEEQVEVPSFGQLLDLYDLIPRAVQVIADRTGLLEGSQVRQGDSIVTRYTLQTDW